MKKLISLSLFIFLLIGSFILFSNRTKDYEITYEKDNFSITESYQKDKSNYYFTLINNDIQYDFVVNNKYSKNRKLVNKLDVKEKDDYKCVSIKVFGDYLPYICNKDEHYYDSFTANIEEQKKPKEIKKISQISVYNTKHDYYLWNGYGITSILDNKDYNFLKKESYDNNLSYQMHEYLIVADYDSTREFSKFYVFNFNTKKVSEFKFDYKISFNSYFMGDYDNLIYLFDRKNKIQYRINLDKKEMDITSDKEGVLYYKDGWNTLGINKVVYNDIYFENTNLINYSLKDDALYYNYMSSDINILFDKNDISTILDYEGNDIYYLKKDSLYKYNVNDGKTLLLSYFEWNFSYSNKIFIFN